MTDQVAYHGTQDIHTFFNTISGYMFSTDSELWLKLFKDFFSTELIVVSSLSPIQNKFLISNQRFAVREFGPRRLNETMGHIITVSKWMTMLPNGWINLFPADFLDSEQLKKALKYVIWIPDEHWMVNQTKIEDDDPSYTEGYRLGRTKLKWL